MAEAVARLVELSEDERARLRADARGKWEWDNACRMRQSREEGLAEGKAEVALRMLRAKMPVSEIADLIGWPAEEIERLAAEEKK